MKVNQVKIPADKTILVVIILAIILFGFVGYVAYTGIQDNGGIVDTIVLMK